ncbi:MAG: hypothetical protein M3Y91_02745 [Actinomycetota bacterium]|nr:hypothetical protein [Actinomycetota bacterium]
MTGPAASWWAGVPPVELSVDCRGHSHRLRWEDGVLSTPDHRGAGRLAPITKGDPPRAAAEERADDLAGEGCEVVSGAWRTYRDDPRVLVLARRHPGDTVSRRVAQASDDPLARLLGVLDPALERRLQLEVAHTVGARYAAGTSEAVILEAATVGRSARILERWLGPGRRSSVTIATSSGVAEEDGGAAVSLAPTWLAQVWARYLSLVDGFLVLEVNRIVEDRAEVIGLGRPGGDPALLTLRGPAPWRAISRQPLSGPR